MQQLIWQDRLCIIDKDGTWMMSRVGRYGDFDFMPLHPDKDQAVAGTLPGGLSVDRLCVLDDARLLFVSGGSVWMLTGNPCDRGRFDCLDIVGK